MSDKKEKDYREAPQYLLIPAKSGTAKKLIVMLHGYGKNGYTFLNKGRQLSQAFPDADIILPHGFWPMGMAKNLPVEDMRVPDDVFNHAENIKLPGEEEQREWFSMKNGMVHLWFRIHHSANILNTLIDKERDARGLQDKDVALIGFSQGGTLALYTAYRRPTSLSCVVGHSALFMGKTKCLSKPPTYFIYGLADDAIMPRRYQKTLRHLKRSIPDLDIQTVEGLQHRVSSASLRHVVGYVRQQFEKSAGNLQQRPRKPFWDPVKTLMHLRGLFLKPK